jgi:SAM-dependent methyltransferase
MADTDRVFTGSIPELYERYLVPLIFQPYAEDLARRIAAARPERVLETASGTGVLTRAMRRTLPQSASIVTTDLNPPMLDYARSIASDLHGVEWRQADALKLPFDDGTFDAVACQFGAMFFPDKARGFAEARRVLKNGGHFMFNVWDRIAENEFALVVQQALAELYPDDPPKFMERTPHGYHDTNAVGQALAAAGFATFQFETVTHVSRAPSALAAATGYCQGSPWRMEIEARGGVGLDAATKHAAATLAKRFGDGPIEGKIQAHVVSVTKS